jgi:hypothetical protein
MPEINATCTDYLVRLMASGTSTDTQNGRPFPRTDSCDELPHTHWLPPSSNEDYVNCKNYILRFTHQPVSRVAYSTG